MLKHKKSRAYLVLLLVVSLMLAPAGTSLGGEGAGLIQDNELVLVSLGDDGIDKLEVLNNLHISGGDAAEILDGMNYRVTSIRNIYGTEQVQSKGTNISVKASVKGQEAFKDIYYLAEIDKQEISRIKMPVEVKMEYYLNGNPTPPSQLAGKSGHLKIVCRLENKTGQTKMLEFTDSKGNTMKKETMVFTPYVVSLSGWEFDNKKFSNISAPGKPGECPEGVIVNVKGISTVNWSVPMIPPKFPAKQYTVLEADARDIQLPSFKIAVIPIVPTTAEVDNIPTIRDSFYKLYDGFDQIEKGVGNHGTDATILFGLNAIGNGLTQVSGGLGTLVEKVKMVRFGISNPAFKADSFNQATGADANGATPGLKEAVGLLKSNVDGKVIPALKLQRMVLGLMETSIGTAGEEIQEPSAATSLYNDINFLKQQVPAPQQQIISQSIEPKLQKMAANVKVFQDGGNLATATGSMPFPANIAALEAGSQQISATLAKVDMGLAVVVMGLGQVDKNGQPVKVMVDGKPGSILYALSYLQGAIDGQMLPGINKLQDGAGKIGTGAGGAKEAIAAGLETFESAPAIVSALEENASQTDSFLGKPEGATGSVAYVFQTPEISKQADVMKLGVGVLVVALILLFAVGRPPKQAFEAPAEHA